MQASHFKIRNKLPELWNQEVQFWVPILKTIGITEKVNMKKGSKFRPTFNRNN